MPASDAVDICVTDSTAFIVVAEDAGIVIISLTDFVLRSASRQLSEWQLRDASTAELQRRGKVSGNELANSGFLARVTAALVGARLQPQRLTIKLTQNIPTERLAPMPLLSQPRRPGIEPCINDFRIGKSPVPRLPSLPVTRLKIDPAFFDGLQRVSNEAAVVRAVIVLGDSLRKSVIAEGIESEPQMEQLRPTGCRVSQISHRSRPCAPELIEKMLDGMVAQAFATWARKIFEEPLGLH